MKNASLRSVAVLFARPDSVYLSIAGCEVYDAVRNALTWPGHCPVVAHPPCRAWGKLRTFARPVAGELALAAWAVGVVRVFGGVLEHPAGSTLWREMNLPLAGSTDVFGGWTYPVLQQWFGHKAAKATWLYICGSKVLPEVPFVLGDALYVVQSRKRSGYRPHITKAEREHTPRAFAEWLVAVARSCRV